ncbi:MFS transporter [Cohnella zeiphila]|uniref:MFS transporter n=1 Tax=Cohnella zeiphila TaxID=2761120 RepID=A0A7X0VUW0_9BACL|nr:MFS transporter [Cohnella zeiphila]MBB6730717.1 MFS transporter [Cohnella zeiphila]
MRTAIWLYLFLFVAFFDLHAQYPMLTPFAVSLGAAPSFIGLVMGMYSLTHLPGNLIAGFAVDRFGSRLFIAASLSGAGVLLLLQSQVSDPWHLLYIRSASGFVLAFLSPACLTLLARLAKNHIHQGKLMAGNGLVHTIASVVSPAAGAWLAAELGFTQSFAVLGWILLITGIGSLWFVREPVAPLLADSPAASRKADSPAEAQALQEAAPGRVPWAVFLLPVAISCAQGVLAFELPLQAKSSDELLTTGLLFSIVSLGSLSTLAMLFLQKYLPYARCIAALALMALGYYALAIGWPLPLSVMLFAVGMSKGIMFPAMTSFLLQLSGPSRFGRTFSYMSIALSIGSFLGPVAAGAVREHMSPFFVSFAVLMLALAVLMPRAVYVQGWNPGAEPPPVAGH